MPYMLVDFLNLFRVKGDLASQYLMPQNVNRLMAAELIHVCASWLEMLALSGRYTREALRDEIERVCGLPEMQGAARQEDLVRLKPEGLRKAIEESDVDAVESIVAERCRKVKRRRRVAALLR